MAAASFSPGRSRWTRTTITFTKWNVAGGAVRQLTFGLGFADYEGEYAPDGQIIFNSTRCVQTVDCWWTEVSNLYTCDGEGRYLRRLGFDQVHSNYPTVTPDGRVLYTRWEYNDRGQIFPQGLFQMNPDGTGQTACYGNNTWFPTTILHARAIPGTQKVVAVFSGHHTIQKGWLGILDPSRGRQENQGAQLIAPLRKTEAVRVDAYGQSGDQFQYPYPLSETEFIVTFRPAGAKGPFAIYWMDQDGRRELLAWDSAISCNQPVPLAPRPVPPPRPSTVDYRQEYGTYYLQDIYTGPGLAGVPRGTIKRLRVIALSFRAAGIGAELQPRRRRRRPEQHSDFDRQRRLGSEDRAGRSQGPRRRLGRVPSPGKDAHLLPSLG